MTDIVERLRFMEHSASLTAAPVIKEAADEIERLRLHIEELHEKIKAEDCACSYDNPGDVCLTHSPTVERLREALIWCSASDDFQDGGRAREGWLKLCKPLIDAAAVEQRVGK